MNILFKLQSSVDLQCRNEASIKYVRRYERRGGLTKSVQLFSSAITLLLKWIQIDGRQKFGLFNCKYFMDSSQFDCYRK